MGEKVCLLFMNGRGGPRLRAVRIWSEQADCRTAIVVSNANLRGMAGKALRRRLWLVDLEIYGIGEKSRS